MRKKGYYYCYLKSDIHTTRHEDDENKVFPEPVSLRFFVFSFPSFFGGRGRRRRGMVFAFFTFSERDSPPSPSSLAREEEEEERETGLKFEREDRT